MNVGTEINYFKIKKIKEIDVINAATGTFLKPINPNDSLCNSLLCVCRKCEGCMHDHSQVRTRTNTIHTKLNSMYIQIYSIGQCREIGQKEE